MTVITTVPPDPVKPDPRLYPTHVECPHKDCGKRLKVELRFDPIEGWRAVIEPHNIVSTQCSFGSFGVASCCITYACPASLARVSRWEPAG